MPGRGDAGSWNRTASWRRLERVSVTGGSPDELAAAILELLGDPQRRREMGVCGVRATRARLSWNAVAAQVEELYREVSKGNAQSAAVEPA